MKKLLFFLCFFALTPLHAQQRTVLYEGTPPNSKILPGAICDNLTSYGGWFTQSDQTTLAELIRHERLTGAGSEKDTRHFVLSLEGSGLRYTPGDSLAVLARNSPQLVEEVITLLGFDGNAPIQDSKTKVVSFRQALAERYILNRASKKIMSGLCERIPQGEQRNQLMEIVDNGEVLGEYVHSRDYVDILKHLIDYWHVDTIKGLTGDAAKAQDELCQLPLKLPRWLAIIDSRVSRQQPTPFSWIHGRKA